MNAAALTPVTEARQAYRRMSTLADTLIGLRRRFSGDLDQYLLYMTVVQAEVDQSLRREPAGAALNALSLAETCGVPRETARAKLRRMAEAGLLAVGADSLLRLPDAAAAGREYALLAPLAERRP